MRIRTLLLPLLIGAGLFLPTQTPASARTHSKSARKFRKTKRPKRFKAHKVKHRAHR